MPAGSVPEVSSKTSWMAFRPVAPMAWRLYRFGLMVGGLAWICIASTLCGCGNMNGWVMNQSGRGYYNRGNYAAAKSEFERALLDDPYNATYAYNVGKAMEKMGDVSGAEQMYQHALTLNPSHQPAYHGLSELLVAQGRSDEARALLTAWAQTQPYSAAAYVELAELEREQGNFAAAQQNLATALKIKPRSRLALNERARLAAATGQPMRGGPFAELALSSQPPSTPNQGPAIVSTPQQSSALHMAQTLPQKDPTLMGGIIQASYSRPQFSQQSGTLFPTMAAGSGSMAVPQISQAPIMQPQLHQTHMIPQPIPQNNGWMPVQSGPQSAPTGPIASPAPTLVPPAALQPTPNAPQGQPIELGQPVPITQVSPTFVAPSQEVAATPAPASKPTVISGIPTVQAF